MATRRIRLTESELTNLIRRIVEDTENVDNMGMEPMLDEPKREGKGMSWIMSAAREVADMFKREVLPNLSDEEKELITSLAALRATSNLRILVLFHVEACRNLSIVILNRISFQVLSSPQQSPSWI